MAEIHGSPCDTKYLSDADSDEERRRRRLRRKRGGTRYRPYSTSPDSQPEDNEEPVDRKENDRVPMAPSNTTQFLVEDLEARIGHNTTPEKSEVSKEVHPENDQKKFAHSTDPGSSSDESSLDREFESSCLDVKRQRIEKMSKLELEQELLDRDYDADVLNDKCRNLDSENRQLRELLNANGIAVSEDVVSSTSPINGHESKSPSVTAN